MEGKIDYSLFEKVDLRVGKVVSVENHPNADKLFVFKVDLGEAEPRTIVAGLRKHYAVEDLLGKKAIFVANLEPVVLRGVQSDGMILAAANADDSKVVFLEATSDVDEGSRVKFGDD